MLKKIGRKFDSVIERVNANKGRVAPELFVEEFLPDPMRIKDIPVDNSEGFFSWYKGQFSNISMHGVKQVRIESVRANVGKFNAKVIVRHNSTRRISFKTNV